jgi:hypothetical protein
VVSILLFLVIEETVNNALTPRKTKVREDLFVFDRLYALHEEKMVDKVLIFFCLFLF